MSWKVTWTLVASAAVLFAFIYFFEGRLEPSDSSAREGNRLVSIKPAEVTVIQLRRTNQFILRAERTNQNWALTAPINYPAQGYAIEHLLNMVSALASSTFISAEELNASHKSIAEFGLDIPSATLTLHHNGRRTELLLGSRTAAGDQLYVQVLNRPGIFVVPAEIINRVPRSANQWRDVALINLEGLTLDRFEVRNQDRGFAVQVNPTNRSFYLIKPTPARADRARVEAVLRKLQTEPVVAFVADDLRADLDQYGLQPPVAEVAFGNGTNDLVTVQFGKSPSNDVVYARRSANNNIVLVSKSVMEAVQVSAVDLRDKHLLIFDPSGVDTIDVAAEEKFTIRKQGTNSWIVSQPEPMLADADLVQTFLNLLVAMEGDIEKDVVIDFGVYGLAKPLRQYVLRATGTNQQENAGRLIAQLDAGGRREGKIYARGGETTVYTVDPRFMDELPIAAWQLRDRRVWSFSSNQVARLTVRRGSNVRQMVRGTAGDWKLELGQGIIEPRTVEWIVKELGELRASFWVNRGEGKRQLYGFRDDSDKLSIELKNGDKPRVLTVEFGDQAKSGCPYALAMIDGQTWVFEFPLSLYVLVAQKLLAPLGVASAKVVP